MRLTTNALQHTRNSLVYSHQPVIYCFTQWRLLIFVGCLNNLCYTNITSVQRAEHTELIACPVCMYVFAWSPFTHLVIGKLNWNMDYCLNWKKYLQHPNDLFFLLTKQAFRVWHCQGIHVARALLISSQSSQLVVTSELQVSYNRFIQEESHSD